MNIKVKALSAEIEISLPDENEKPLAYHSEKVKALMTHAKDLVIEIENSIKEDKPLKKNVIPINIGGDAITQTHKS